MIKQFNFTVSGEKILKLSIYLLAILICFPLSMTLPSLVRMTLQILSVIMFVLSLILIKKFKYILCLCILFIISYLYYISSWAEVMNASTYLFNSLCCWELVISSTLFLNRAVKADIKIFWFITFITLVTAVTTIAGLIRYPLAVRELGRSFSYSGENVKVLYRNMNIASWSQLYGMVFIQGCLTYCYKKTKKILILISVVITEICILSSQLTFAILLSIIILFLTMTNIKSKYYYFFVMVFIFIAAILLFNISNILLWSINLSESHKFQMLTSKLRDLYNLTSMNVSTGNVSARVELYLKSLKSFAKYPFGMFGHGNLQASNYIGYHSELFDFIGAMGLIGIAIIIILFINWSLKIKKIKVTYENRYLFFMFLSFIIICILNPVFYSPQIWLGAFLLPSALVSYTLDRNTLLSEKEII